MAQATPTENTQSREQCASWQNLSIPDDLKLVVLAAIDSWALNWRQQDKINDRLIGLWMSNIQASRLTVEQVKQASAYCLADLKFFPVWSDFITRVPRPEPDYLGQPATLDSLSQNSAMPWYFRWHLAYMRKHRCKWSEARTAMMAEADRRGQKLPRQIVEGKFSWEMED